MNRCTVLFLVALLCFSCKKEKLDLPYEVIQTDASVNINNLCCTSSDTIYACGGKQGKGVVLKSVDGGRSWNILSNSFNYNLYSIIIFPNGSGYAGADSSHVYTTTDGGLTWSLYFDWTGIPFQYHCPLRNVYFANADTGFFAGGHFFDRGIIYYTTDGGVNWHTQGFEHELRAICQTKEGFISAGYGALLTAFSSTTFSLIDGENDFYTGLTIVNPDKVFACSYNGGLYEMDRKATLIKTHHKPNNVISSREHFLCIDARNENIIACGLSGIVSMSTNASESFDTGYSLNQNRVNAVKLLNDSIALAAGDAGRFFRIKIK